MRRLGVGRGVAPAGGGRTYPRASGRLRVTVRRYYERPPLSWLDGGSRTRRNPAHSLSPEERSEA